MLKLQDKMKISLTGANGFIGRNLLAKLLQANHTVKILSNQSCPNRLVKVCKGDFSSNANDIYNFLKDSDVLINCAGEISNIKKMKNTNFIGVKKILNIIKDRNISIKFLQLSSAGVYQKNYELNNYEYINEKNKNYSNNIYEQSKLQADTEIMAHAKNYIILRPTAIYSKDMPNNSLRNLIKFVEKRYYFYIGDKNSILSYLHVDDLTDTIMNIILKDYFNNQIYNLSNDTKLKETIDRITDIYNTRNITKQVSKGFYKFLIILLPKFLKLPISSSIYNALTSKTIIDSSLAKKNLQFNPTRCLHEHIDELIS